MTQTKMVAITAIEYEDMKEVVDLARKLCAAEESNRLFTYELEGEMGGDGVVVQAVPTEEVEKHFSDLSFALARLPF